MTHTEVAAVLDRLARAAADPHTAALLFVVAMAVEQEEAEGLYRHSLSFLRERLPELREKRRVIEWLQEQEPPP